MGGEPATDDDEIGSLWRMHWELGVGLLGAERAAIGVAVDKISHGPGLDGET